MNHAAAAMPDRPERRGFIAGGIWLALVGCGLISRAQASLAPPVDSVGAALKAIAGRAEASERVQLRLPRLIEDGAVVPVTVSTELTGVRELYVLADMNPMPIAAQFRLGAGVAPRMALRVKLADSGRVYGAVRTDDGLFWTAADAVVAVGGCR
jgi:sulfur-oxidizing protein SoxY